MFSEKFQPQLSAYIDELLDEVRLVCRYIDVEMPAAELRRHRIAGEAQAQRVRRRVQLQTSAIDVADALCSVHCNHVRIGAALH